MKINNFRHGNRNEILHTFKWVVPIQYAEDNWQRRWFKWSNIQSVRSHSTDDIRGVIEVSLINFRFRSRLNNKMPIVDIRVSYGLNVCLNPN
jgi:hypothetical protein